MWLLHKWQGHFTLTKITLGWGMKVASSSVSSHLNTHKWKVSKSHNYLHWKNMPIINHHETSLNQVVASPVAAPARMVSFIAPLASWIHVPSCLQRWSLWAHSGATKGELGSKIWGLSKTVRGKPHIFDDPRAFSILQLAHFQIQNEYSHAHDHKLEILPISSGKHRSGHSEIVKRKFFTLTV
jgi:hypothetical protein